MGLPQETIELCLKYKTDITTEMHNMDKKIKDWSEYRVQEPPPQEERSPGPLDPNCFIPEDEFSPSSEHTGAHTRSRVATTTNVRS